MIKKIIALLLCLCVILSISGCKTKKHIGSIYDAEQNVVVNFADINTFQSENAAYVDVVVTEALSIISEIKKLNIEAAKKQIVNYDVYTYLDKDLVTAIEIAYGTVSGTNFGCAIVNLNGELIATYSSSPNDNKNFATQKMQQHSTMKPLSVYAPAIEKQLINWSTMTEDSPYKVLTNSKGVKYDWPSNAGGKYSRTDITIYEALKKSINTVAVKVLSDYGVNNSIDFLQKNFNIDLSYEQQKSTIYGEDEVIGNIALGATMSGSTPIDMAGYYQIFANGGKYTAPKAIEKIVDKNGKVIYKNKPKTTQVISTETSCIMTEMLRGVTRAGGTGNAASVNGIEVAGKTGTGDAFVDNWFVGVTPEYSCAVWHSSINQKNMAAHVFSVIVENSDIQISRFMTSPNVKKQIYCRESGMLLGENCKNAEMGHYLKDGIPALCNLH